MVELLRNQVSELHFEKFPDPPAHQCWMTNFKTEVCSCSGCLSDVVLWINEVEAAKSVDDLMTSQSLRGLGFPNFEMLDAKIASALKGIISNPYFRKRISVEEQKSSNTGQISLRKTDCLYDQRAFPSQWRS